MQLFAPPTNPAEQEIPFINSEKKFWVSTMCPKTLGFIKVRVRVRVSIRVSLV